MNKGLLSSLAVLFCVVLAGCGDGSVQSGGTVTFTTGAPVPSGLVFFEDPQFSYRGTIENGSYKIEGVTKGSGLPPGTYKVYVMGTDPNTDASLFDAKYTSPDTSGLMFEAKKGDQNVFDFKVEPAK